MQTAEGGHLMALTLLSYLRVSNSCKRPKLTTGLHLPLALFARKVRQWMSPGGRCDAQFRNLVDPTLATSSLRDVRRASFGTTITVSEVGGEATVAGVTLRFRIVEGDEAGGRLGRH